MTGARNSSQLCYTNAFKRLAGRNRRVVLSQNVRRLSQSSNGGCDEINTHGNQPDRILGTPPDRLYLSSLQVEQALAGNRGHPGPSTRRMNHPGHSLGAEEHVVGGGCRDQLMRDAEARRNPLSEHSHDVPVLEDHLEGRQDGVAGHAAGRQNGVEASSDHITLERSALQRLRDDPWRKKARELTKENLVLVESLKRFQETTASKPKCCQLKHVKKVMTDVATKILLGNFVFSTMYPTEDILVECILAAFNIPPDDHTTREKFLKEWGPLGDEESSLHSFATRNIRERRGSITRDLRNELFKVLEVTKPDVDATPQELQTYATQLQTLCEGDQWRFGSDSNGVSDPYGSQAFYGAIAKVVLGRRYDRKGIVCVTLEQCGFFYHVMNLAMHGKNLTEGHASMHIRAMKCAEDEIKKNLWRMSRVIIVEADADR